MDRNARRYTYIYLLDGISECIGDREIRPCTENRTKMGNIYRALTDGLSCRTLSNLSPASVTNASVTRPITGSPSIYEVLAVLRRAMGRQAREEQGGIEGKGKRAEKRERKRGRGKERFISYTPSFSARCSSASEKSRATRLSRIQERGDEAASCIPLERDRPFPDGNEIVVSSGRSPTALFHVSLGCTGHARRSAHGIV